MRSTCTPLALLLLLAIPVRAEDRPFPYALGRQDLLALPVSVGMTAWGTSLRAGHDPITWHEISGLRPSDVNAFDRSATHNWSYEWDDRSDRYRDWTLRSTLFLLGVESVRGGLSETATLATMFVELYFLTKGATYMTKAIAGRKRPYVFNTAMSVDERYGIASSDGNDVFFSFYSGHVAAAFAAATFSSKVFTDIHGKSVWSHLVWGSTLSLAAATGYARVKSGVHFPSDAIAGAVVGGAIGYLVPMLHRKDPDRRLSLVVAPNQVSFRLRF